MGVGLVGGDRPRGAVGRGSAASSRRGPRLRRPGAARPRATRSGSRSSGSCHGVDDHLGLLDQQVAGGERGGGRGRGCPGRGRAGPPGARPARVCLVWCASQFAVEVAPAAAPTTGSRRAPRPAASSSATRAFSRVSATSVLRSPRRPSTTPRRRRRRRRSAWAWATAADTGGGSGHRCHGSTQALATDSQGPRSLVLFGILDRSEKFFRPISASFAGVVSRLASLAPQPPGSGRKAGKRRRPHARRTRFAAISARNHRPPAGRDSPFLAPGSPQHAVENLETKAGCLWRTGP